MANYAGWRAISRSLVRSKKWKRASNPARVLWVTILLQADSWGALEADPETLQDVCLPNVPGWTPELVAECLAELDAVDLVQLYAHEGQAWVQVTDFDDHQHREFTRKRGRRRSPEPPARAGVQRAKASASEAPANDGSAGLGEPIHSTTYKQLPNGSSGGLTPTLSDDGSGGAGAAVDTAAADPVADQVAAVFQHWRTLEETKALPDGPPGIRAPKQTPGRSTVIKARLREGYTVEQLCQAVTAFLNDPWHLGTNNRETRYTDLTTLLKNASKVDAGRVKWEQQQSTQAKPKGPSRVRPAAT